MIYKIIVKQIDIVEVNAFNEDQAINLLKNKLDPKALVELQIVEEIKISNE